ncbi:MAG: tRNA (adenosine(37)-N6)-dimethylallyltransferase MiaA [Verrucomicrobiota bacterium]
MGPSAVGKTAFALQLAREENAEIVNADAFQIYQGLNLLTGKPDHAQQLEIRHHLLGAISPMEEMSAGRFCNLAQAALADIAGRGMRALVVGGTGLYVKTLTHGLDHNPPPDRALRAELMQLSLPQLQKRLQQLAPALATRIDLKNHRRVTRAIEITTAKDHPKKTSPPAGNELPIPHPGIVLTRDRDDLYRRINERVNKMFADGVEAEVRATIDIGPTARRAIGFEIITQLLAGAISRAQAIDQMQQATRRYAKRQLTWFRRQTTFSELNLTALSQPEAISAIRQMMRTAQR